MIYSLQNILSFREFKKVGHSMKDNMEVGFCSSLWCSYEDAKTCSFVFSSIVDLHSCINHAMIVCVDTILVLICLFIFIYKSFKNAPPLQSQNLSLVLIFSSIYNAFLSFAYLGWGLSLAWKELYKSQSVLPLHKWFPIFFHGFTWLLVSITVSLNKLQLPFNRTVKFCYVIIFYAGFLFTTLAYEAFVGTSVSVKMVLDVLCLPGSILLLVGTLWRGHNYVDTNFVNGGDDSYKLLQGEEIDADVTLFAKAGLFSTMSFWWLNPLLAKGKKKILEEKDIPQLRPQDQAHMCYSSYLQQVSEQKGSSNSSSTLMVILSCQWKAILVSGFFALIKALTLIAGPLFLRAFIKVASGKESFRYEAYVLTGGLFLAKGLESVSERQWYFRTRLIGLQVRSMLSAAIFQKQIRLSNAAKLTYSPGEIVSYVTVDAYKIGEFPSWFHQIWTTSLQLGSALIIVYYSLGLASTAALITVILTVLASSPLSKLQHKYHKKLMAAQDRRLKAIAEALTNMKILKLYAWETHFKNIIEGLRGEESKWIRKVLSQKGQYLVLFYASPILVPAITLWACYFLDVSLNASNCFTFLATLRIIQDQIRRMPEVAGIFIEAKVSFSRIDHFLGAPELENTDTRRSNNENHVDLSIFMSCAEISWDSLKATLRNIQLMVRTGEKVAICGGVGSGKSTLLAAILGEVPKISGTVSLWNKLLNFINFNYFSPSLNLRSMKFSGIYLWEDSLCFSDCLDTNWNHSRKYSVRFFYGSKQI